MAKIKAEKIDIYEPYSHGDTVFLDCSSCGNEYEWINPFTACNMDYSEGFSENKTCRMYPATLQARCIKCQVKLRIEQARIKYEK